jgi:hypothetical protein
MHTNTFKTDREVCFCLVRFVRFSSHSFILRQNLGMCRRVWAGESAASTFIGPGTFWVYSYIHSKLAVDARREREAHACFTKV